MTKEEAIKIINCYDIGFYDLSGEKIPADKLAEAFDMAIEALQRTDTHECVEMINREDAIIAVRKHRIDIDSPHKIVRKTYEDVIRDLPFEPVGISDTLEWIPCSERLPKIDEEVLVYLFGDSPHLAWYDGHKWQTDYFTVDDDERPIAWMRLPKPWKGEGDD